MNRFEIEREWTHEGLACAVLIINTVVGSHRCGYVIVPPRHPWSGLGYDDEAQPRLRSRGDVMATPDPMENFGAISVLANALKEASGEETDATVGMQLRVHGGVTYADSPFWGTHRDGWAFGFDCAHAGDTKDRWTHDAVVAETERLATQLASMLP